MSTSRQEQRAAASGAEAQRAGEQMAHARQAAREITHERTESARVVGGVAGAAHEEGQPQPQHVEVHRGGILETVHQGARSLVSAVGRKLGVASRDVATAESPLAESKDHAARGCQGTESAAENAKDTARSDDTAARSPEEKVEEYKRSAAAGRCGVACTER